MSFNKKILLIVILATFTNKSWSQQAQKNIAARNTVYADYVSQRPHYSLNYDRIFSEGTKFIKSYRAGFSVSQNTISLPLGISFFTGQNASHAEFSLTLVPYIETYKDLFSGNNLSDKKMNIIPGVGYRYQKPTGGIFFRAAVAPIIALDPPSDHFWKMDTKLYAGVTVGAGVSF